MTVVLVIDLSIYACYRNDFEKLAVLGGQKWVEWATKIGSNPEDLLA